MCKRTMSSRLLTAVATIIVGAGCSEESPETDIAASAYVDVRADKKRAAIAKGLKEGAAFFSKQPGRTGILLEKNHYSIFSEELMIRDFFQDRRNGFFVDVGCAWPDKANNTYYLERHLGWTGIGIDALDDYAELWKEVRPKSKFFNFLVTDRSDALGTFYKSKGLGLSSTNRLHAGGSIFGLKDETKEIQVPMITLADLLDREGIVQVDLLAMDIEGHELTALKGFDFGRFQPELLVIEGRRRPVKELLTEHGYEQIMRYAKFDQGNRYFRRAQANPTTADSPPGS